MSKRDDEEKAPDWAQKMEDWGQRPGKEVGEKR